MADDVTLTIDGLLITVPKGTLLIEAAKQLGIDIPVFCYHHKLEPVGACRQCLVDIEGYPKPQASCSVPVAEGMVVHTDTPGVKQYRQSVLEFLLLNHPLDCPVCDRGGECMLQDNTMKYGPPDSRFEQEKRHYEKPVALSALVVLDRERCIQCFRCVRFQREIAHQPDIQMLDRGFGDYIATFPGKPFEPNFSGNTIELCPVGALLSSVFRFRGRPWELSKTESICPNCGVGCNIEISDRRKRRVVRYLARTNEEVNECWICDRGRFDSLFINSPERLTKSLVRKNGELVESDWEEAISAAIQGMRSAGGRAGALGSPKRSNEQNYLLQKFMRLAIGSNHIDFSTEQRPEGMADALALAMSSGLLNGSIADIASSDVTVSLGMDISRDLPLIDLWVKRAVTKLGREFIFAYPLSAELSSFASMFLPYKHGDEREFIQSFAAAVSKEGSNSAAGVRREQFEEVLCTIEGADSVALLLSSAMLYIPAVKSIVDSLTGRGVKVRTILLMSDGNAQGSMDVGLLPGYFPGYLKIGESSSREMGALWGENPPVALGLSGWEMMSSTGAEIQALWIMGQDPAKDPLHGEMFAESLAKLSFLVVQDSFLTETAKMADVVLPSSTFAETKGTFTNTERRVQRFSPAVRCVDGSKPDTEILFEAARLAGAERVSNFGSIEEIFGEITRVVPSYAGMTYEVLGPLGKQWKVER